MDIESYKDKYRIHEPLMIFDFMLGNIQRFYKNNLTGNVVECAAVIVVMVHIYNICTLASDISYVIIAHNCIMSYDGSP